MEQSIALVIHDLNNPLSHIKICSHNIEKNNDEKSIKINTERINYRVNQLIQTIIHQKNNLYHNMRIAELEEIHALDFIKSLKEDFISVNRDAIEIHISGENFKIKGDKLYISSIFNNLLQNAFFFIKKAKKGRIEITLSSYYRKNRISIKDTGYGIHPEILPHIFEKGFSDRNGTGMGLYICKSMIEALNGRIYCKSVFGEFTTFIIEFPTIHSQKS